MFFRRQHILNCYTDRPEVYEYSKLVRGTNAIPSWFKNLKRSGEEWSKPNSMELLPELTMKSCPGIIDVFKNSWVLPLWSDLRILVGAVGTDHYNIAFADNRSVVEVHDDYQYVGLTDKTKHQHVKLANPWLFISESPLKWAWLPPSWHTLDYETVEFLSAITEFKSQHSAHVNLFIRRLQNEKSLTLPFGLPLVYLVPLTELPVRVKHHLVSTDELRALEAKSVCRLKFLNDFSLKKRVIN